MVSAGLGGGWGRGWVLILGGGALMSDFEGGVTDLRVWTEVGCSSEGLERQGWLYTEQTSGQEISQVTDDNWLRVLTCKTNHCRWFRQGSSQIVVVFSNG